MGHLLIERECEDGEELTVMLGAVAGFFADGKIVSMTTRSWAILASMTDRCCIALDSSAASGRKSFKAR